MTPEPLRPIRRRTESFVFLDGPQPTFEESTVEIATGLALYQVNAPFLENLAKKGVGDVAAVADGCATCIHGTGTDSTADLLRPGAFHDALILATDVRAREHGHIIRDIDPPWTMTASVVPEQGTVLWGHFRRDLSLDDVEKATQLLPHIEQYQTTEKFSRVGNALLFYNNGYNSNNPDLALMAFATCLESLFSTVEQELSFRLALRVATFLADENAEREELFEEARELYRIRSKVVHGAAIHKNRETAAIRLVEGIVPQAERLARKCLARVFELSIEAIFEQSDKLNALFDKLLFRGPLASILADQSGVA